MCLIILDFFSIKSIFKAILNQNIFGLQFKIFTLNFVKFGAKCEKSYNREACSFKQLNMWPS